MSDYESILQNNTTIRNNNLKIQRLINQANLLPDPELPTATTIKKDINFYDYDGTLLYSYTVAEAKELTELPALPSHKGLICQGWNYKLSEMKSCNGPVDIGAMYITDDGATRLYIHLEEGRLSPKLILAGDTVSVNINWGDSATSETYTIPYPHIGISHTYETPGDYVISIMPDDSDDLVNDSLYIGGFPIGSETVSGGIIRFTEEPDGRNKVYSNVLRHVELGKCVRFIESGAFQFCYSLETITIPQNVRRFDDSCFYNCLSLKHIVIPNISDEVIDLEEEHDADYRPYMGASVFNSCHKLKTICFPSLFKSNDNTNSTSTFFECSSLSHICFPEVEKIAAQFCYACNSLINVKFSDNLQKIAHSAFYNCPGVKCYDFTSCTSVPQLSNVNIFTSISDDCVILVPENLKEQWKAATNWSNFADKIKSSI